MRAALVINPNARGNARDPRERRALGTASLAGLYASGLRSMWIFRGFGRLRRPPGAFGLVAVHGDRGAVLRKPARLAHDRVDDVLALEAREQRAVLGLDGLAEAPQLLEAAVVLERDGEGLEEGLHHRGVRREEGLALRRDQGEDPQEALL